MKFTDSQINKVSKELQSKIKGKVLFDPFSRGMYSTDSSLYQINPLGAVLPKDQNDVLNLMEYSQKNSIPLLARGGGSSQCGQTVNEAIVLDYSKQIYNAEVVNYPILMKQQHIIYTSALLHDMCDSKYNENTYKSINTIQDFLFDNKYLE